MKLEWVEIKCAVLNLATPVGCESNKGPILRENSPKLRSKPPIIIANNANKQG